MISQPKTIGQICSKWAVTFVYVCAAATLFSQNAIADDSQAWTLERPLVPFTARYLVGNNSVVAGQADIELAQLNSGNEWHYSLSTKPTGLFRLAGKGRVQESATFQVVANDSASILRPHSYEFRQDNEQKRAVDATFIWEQKRLYFKRGNNNGAEDIASNTLDRMTMTVAMMSNLDTKFDTITMAIFDGGKLKEVLLTNEGNETINTQLGDVETVRVRTRSSAGSTRETITWFAPSLNNIPVRIEQLKNGGLVARLSINQYNPTSKP